MAYGTIKIKKLIAIAITFIFATLTYALDGVNITAKINKQTNEEIVFTVSVINETDKNLYFYPRGFQGAYRVENGTLVYIPNDDRSYYDSNIRAAHRPDISLKTKILLKKSQKKKYKYTMKLKNYKVKIDELNEIRCYLTVIPVDIEGYTLEEYLDVVIDHGIGECVTIPLKK